MIRICSPGAGSDLTASYESASDQILVDVSAASWRVDIRKADTTWHGNFQLFVRRTSDGIGGNPISGGTTYQEITGTDQSFFNGNDKLRQINVQLKLDNVSLQIPADTYSTTVHYTIVDTS